MKKSKYFIFSSILTSLFASICCIVPLILALLGLTGVAAFSFLEPLRPYLISASVILFGFAFYFVYRKKIIVIEDGSRRIIKAGKRNRLAVWVAVVISIAVIIFPFFETQASGKVNNNTKQKSNISTKVSKNNLNITLTNSGIESFSKAGKECCTQTTDTLKRSVTKDKTK